MSNPPDLSRTSARSPQPANSTANAPPAGRKAAPPARILLVDATADLRQSIEAAATPTRPVELVQADSLAHARHKLDHFRDRGGVDLAVIAAQLPDGSGLDLAERLGKSRKMTHTLVVTRSPDLDRAVRAIRAGVSDYITVPAELDQLSGRVRRALTRQGREKRRNQRVRRLRRLCRKLNEARLDVSRQVETLCEDLIQAYRELAEQTHAPLSPEGAGDDRADLPDPDPSENLPASSDDYAVLIRDELDLESLIRTTLQYLVERAGPANAAVFLPASMDEYALGGYVNYDVAQEAAPLVLDHLADILAPRVADAPGEADALAPGEVVHIRDRAAFLDYLGPEAVFLQGRELLAFAAAAEDGEPLAVITLFRDGRDPFPPDLAQTCRRAAPRLGQALARVIKVHHRHLPFDIFSDEGEDDPDSPF